VECDEVTVLETLLEGVWLDVVEYVGEVV